MTKRQTDPHRQALEILSRYPEIIGIPKTNVMTATIEQVLFLNGNFYSEVDLALELNNKELIIIEFKSNGHSRLIKKAQSQLKKSLNFYRETKGARVEGRIITGVSHPCLVKKCLLPKKINHSKIYKQPSCTKINKALRILGNNPEILGIDQKDVTNVSINQLLFYRGNFYTKAGLVFDFQNKDSTIIEYGSNSYGMSPENLENRLERAVDFYQKIKGIAHVEGRMIPDDLYPELINYKSSRRKSRKPEPRRRHSRPIS